MLTIGNSYSALYLHQECSKKALWQFLTYLNHQLSSISMIAVLRLNRDKMPHIFESRLKLSKLVACKCSSKYKALELPMLNFNA